METLCKLDAGKGLSNHASWAPTLVFAPATANGSKPVWNLFYSGDKAPRNQPGNGIVHAVSTTDSIEGPYVDLHDGIKGAVVPYSHAFSLWQLDNGTYMSFRNNVPGATSFSVGLERAVDNEGKSLGGPW